MHFLTKLKTTLLYKTLVNNLFLVAFAVLLLALSLDTWYFVFLFFIYLIFLFKKNKKLLIISLIIIVIVIIIYLIKKTIIYDQELNSFTGLVINKETKTTYNKLLIKNGIYKVYVYDYDFLDIKIGDKVTVNGENRKIEANHLPNLFNYQKYYYSQNIISVIKAKNITINKRFNYLIIRRLIYQYIDNHFDDISCSFIKGMILGDTSYLSQDTTDAIKINNISHLFAISGLHINLIVLMLLKVLSLFIKNEERKENIVITFLLIYLLITNFGVSISRAVFMYIINIINKRKKLLLSSLDIVSFTFIIFIIYNPFYIYNIAFVLSFLASFIIILFSSTTRYLNKQYQNLIELLLITIALQISSLPVVINLNNYFNIISSFTNVLFITLVSFIMLPVTFIVMLVPLLGSLYSYLVRAFFYLVDFTSRYFAINLSLPSFSKIGILIYYLLIVGFITLFKYLNKKKKVMCICTFSIFLFIYYQKINLNINGNIYFLDLYEGDATLIDLPLNNGVVLIDTGAESKDVIKFIKSIGVRKIDYLILTHNHADHMGNARDIINEFKVKELVISSFNDNDYGIAPRYVKGGDIIKLHNYDFVVLSPTYNHNDENDNSIVLYTKLGKQKYLFLGDVSKRVEEELVNAKLDIDCVKVAHHGSKTSTSPLLYEDIKPKNVFIETGRKEKFSFPNREVIDYLKKYNIYRTDEDYTIVVSFNSLWTKIKKTRKDF